MDPTPQDVNPDSLVPEVHSEADRYDGSRTPADRQLLIWQLFEREKRTPNDIARILGMKPYTVQAVIARRDELISDARMLLKANALEFAHNAIEASKEAASRGKLEGISAMLDRLGVTEPPKSNHAPQVAVQVNLHGGPEPVSLAKVRVESEGPQNQAQSEAGLITNLVDTAVNPPQLAQAQALTGETDIAKVTHAPDTIQAAAFVAESEKQA